MYSLPRFTIYSQPAPLALSLPLFIIIKFFLDNVSCLAMSFPLHPAMPCCFFFKTPNNVPVDRSRLGLVVLGCFSFFKLYFLFLSTGNIFTWFKFKRHKRHTMKNLLTSIPGPSSFLPCRQSTYQFLL